MFFWFTLIDVVSETTRLDWHKVFDLPVIEFLSYVIYIKTKNKKEQERIEQYKRGQKTY